MCVCCGQSKLSCALTGPEATDALPAHAPVLAAAGQRYFCALEQVVHCLNDLSAAALDLPPGFFDEFYTPPDCALRLAHYPPLPIDIAPGQLR